MKQIIFILAVLSYLCLSNKIDLYDAFIASSEPTDEEPSSKEVAAPPGADEGLDDLLQYHAWPKCRSPWNR